MTVHEKEAASILARRTSTLGLRIMLLAGTGLFVALVVAVAVRTHHRYEHFAVQHAGNVYRSAWVEPDVLTERDHQDGFETRAAVLNLQAFPPCCG